MEKLPKILYKYRVWKDENDENDSYEFHRELLTKRRIYYCSPKDINAPFDCKIPFLYDFTDKLKFEKFFEFHTKILFPNITEKEVRKTTEDILKSQVLEKESSLQMLISNQIKRMNKFIGFYSLTKNCKNILMWSHYSNSHKGFCVGFSTQKLKEHQKSYFKRKGLKSQLRQVKYFNKLPLLDGLEVEKKDVLIRGEKSLTSKSIDWKYEKEYRIITFNPFGLTNSQRRDKLPISAFKEVFFGCEMAEPHKEEIKKVLRNEEFKVDLYQAKMKDRSFGLDFEQIEY